ncbi:glycosyltransferase family 9 protein, partial [Acidisphaera rubrifaciens]|uniref:glycosyltransferase family 9 protein n=1 Tax=Acidisphaera rubrifaciens TaxID=50715 RepID=UPI000662C017
AADALAELALALDRHRPADFVYCDESRIDPTTQERTPFYKPGWSPDLLAATNYIGRFWLATGRLLRTCGLDAEDLVTAGDYDLVLRVTEAAQHVAHLPRLLAHREAAALDTDAAELAALEAMRVRRGQTGSTVPGRVPGTWRFLPAARARGLVSIIIPTCAAHGHIRTCLSTLRERTYYRDFETVVIDNIPAEQSEWKEWLGATADRVVEIAEPFNWSRFNNRAVAQARGEWLLFLNDDVEVIEGDWLDRLLDAASEPGVGTVGARLLYPDGKLQHGGMFLANMGQARHAFRFLDREEGGYFGLAMTPRDVSSVTGACLLVSRATFDALGGFDEAHDVINNDLDFNLRTAESGRRVVYAPDATLVHHELASRAGMQDRFDTAAFETRWAARFVEGDPYFNPNLLNDEDGLTPSDEPLQAVFSSGPIIPRAEVRRILAVKVDHIGDFITALPALRRLRRHFPDARLTVLASSAARAFRALEPSIDEIIEFNFFHAKSALGRREVTEEDIAALAEQLRPYAFDIAVDLRKHLDTRKLLRASGARVLAGYDHMGQFPWLDVALEWEGDRNLQAKRYHITDNLVHLVDAVAAATEPPHAPIRGDVLATIDLGDVLTPSLRRLFRRPVVYVHAGAGNDLKQWPIPYFATLIRLLVDREGVNVLLIGGPDEAEIAAELQAAADRPGRIGCVVGAVPLGQLPALLARGALYIGNDSGPKHIAAAVGIPTLGIHSGTVDAVEWAPAAPDALALHRATSCSPCYIAAADLCPRQLACLTLIQPIDVYRHCVRLLALAAADRQPALPDAAGKTAADVAADTIGEIAAVA